MRVYLSFCLRGQMIVTGNLESIQALKFGAILTALGHIHFMRYLYFSHSNSHSWLLAIMLYLAQQLHI